MNEQRTLTSALGRSDARHASETRLQGRWLFHIRAAWVGLTLLTLILNIAALPHYDAVLQSVCAAPAPCLGEQLTATQAHSLQTLGVSKSAYATVRTADGPAKFFATPRAYHSSDGTRFSP